VRETALLGYRFCEIYTFLFKLLKFLECMRKDKLAGKLGKKGRKEKKK